MPKLRKYRAPLLLLPFLLGLTLLVLMRPAPAQEDSRRGWTIEQNGKVTHYPFADRWVGQPNKAGFELRNERLATKVYYYGTFRVTERERDQ